MTWKQRIAAAKKRGEFTLDDMHTAQFFGACAVGEARRRHGLKPPKRSGEDESGKLNDLGYAFYFAVCAGNVARAEELLHAIDAHAAKLKRAALRRAAAKRSL